jgi:hypothetical protein
MENLVIRIGKTITSDQIENFIRIFRSKTQSLQEQVLKAQEIGIKTLIEKVIVRSI